MAEDGAVATLLLLGGIGMVVEVVEVSQEEVVAEEVVTDTLLIMGVVVK